MDKLSPGLVKFFHRGFLLFPTGGVFAGDNTRVYIAPWMDEEGKEGRGGRLGG